MATQPNIERVQENVRRMQAQNATQADVVGYLKTEGYTPTRFEAAVASAKKVGGPPVEAGFGRSLLQGLTFNTADEIEAAMRALMSKGMSAFDAQQTMSGLVTGQKPQSQYEKELSRVRAGIKQYEEQYPGRAFTGELMGGLLQPVQLALLLLCQLWARQWLEVWAMARRQVRLPVLAVLLVDLRAGSWVVQLVVLLVLSWAVLLQQSLVQSVLVAVKCLRQLV